LPSVYNSDDAHVVSVAVPSCSIRSTNASSVADATDTYLSLGSGATVEWDTDSMWNPATPDRVTIKTAGIYALDATIAWSANTTGYRDIGISVNGILASRVGIPNPGSVVAKTHASCMCKLAPGDYVQIYCYQNSGAALSLYPNSYSPRLAATWLRDTP